MKYRVMLAIVLTKLRSFRELIVWQKSFALVVKIYRYTSDFPNSEKFGLVAQMRRSSVSIVSNIAEGSARTDKAFSNFLDYSLGSSFELGTQLIAAQHAKYISEEQFNKINDKNIGELTLMDIREIYDWFLVLDKKLSTKQLAIAKEINKEIKKW